MRMWQTIRSAVLSRHIHEEAYAAVVLSGAYEEAGDQGRFQVEAGDVVLHDCFEAHLDRFSSSGALVLNLRLPPRYSFTPGIAKIADVDILVHTAEISEAEAADLLLSMVQGRTPGYADWPDELAAALIQGPSLCLSLWAQARGLAPWTVSRGFTRVFGVTPEAFRARARARHAWNAIQMTEEPLARIAAHLGFADQAHMTRSVKQMTGVGPRAWRNAANRFKTQATAGV
jgi:AraC-like DNA-binding protein